MLLLSREDIKKVFTMQDAIEVVKKAFCLVVEGECDAPIRTNIRAKKHDGCFLFMPAYAQELTKSICFTYLSCLVNHLGLSTISPWNGF